MAYLDPNEAFEHLKTRVIEGVQAHFPLQGKVQSLHLEKVEVKDDLNPEDIRSQHEAKVKGDSWSVPVYAHLSLKDNATGKVVDSRRIRLLEIPKTTRRHSYLVDGQEYQIDNQWQLKPGVYTRRRQNGELESRFNVSGKSAFDILFDPGTKQFYMEYNKSKLPLYPIMKTMGVDDDTLSRSWGKEIFEANRNARGVAGTVERFYKSTKKENAPSKEEAEKHLWDTFQKSRLRPEATELTLGKSFENVTGETLHLATKKMLKVQGGHPEDDRDSLVFKDLRTAGDFAFDKLKAAGPTIRLKSSRKINTATDVRDVVRFDLFNTAIKDTFHKNSAARTASQINPVEMVSSAMQTTIMGPGGIQSEQSVTSEAKLVNPSHIGFLDPINTPEGEKTGITLRLPLGVRKVGHEPKIPLYNVKTQKTELVSPGKFQTSNVVLPDQVKWEDGKPKPIGSTVRLAGDGEIKDGKFSDAHYVMRHPSQLFNLTSNLIPFLHSTSGNRASMASRHIEQAISLVSREAPLVQVSTGVDKPGIHTFEHLIGQQASHQAPVDGKVVAVKDDAVVVADKTGKKHEVHIYRNYPLNDAKSVLDSTPIVKVGDTVKAGQTVADTNFSKNGALALGTNLRVAYIPFKGYNFEDGIVISESAAGKLSSTHLHKNSLPLDPKTVLSAKKFAIEHPGVFTKDQFSKLGEDGVVRVGQRVAPGDPLIAALTPYQIKDRTGLGAIRRSLSGAHTDSSLRWDSDHEGEVVGVHRSRQGITVHVRTVEPMQVGDKLSNRYGGKGIVTQILPDHEMPHTKDGKHIEVALNPSGVPGRMNPSQIFETAAAKIAEKTGKPYIVRNFSGEDTLTKIKSELKKHNLSDTEQLFDPVTKQPLGHVMVGPQHLLKLVHQVDKKLAVRSGMSGLPGLPGAESYDSNLQPSGGSGTGGQSMGALGMYALLAHGAKANIREMQSWKSEGPDPQTNEAKRWPSQHSKVWNAIQTNTPLPTPIPTFAFKKFETYLKAAGINMEKKGHNLVLSPLTDKQILEMSAGALPKPSELLLAKADKNGEPKPKPGGLFDEKLTGGHGGKKWAHIPLAEPVPNPVFESPIRALTGLSKKDFEALVHGEKAVTPTGTLGAPGSGATGGHGIKFLLDKIDVKSELDKAKRELTKAPAAKVDNALKKVKYLQALDTLNLKPSEAYVLHHLPVLPPAMRPVSVLPSGDFKFADINGLYSEFAQLNSQLKDPTLTKSLPDTAKKSLRADYYDGVRAIMGVGIPYDQANLKGILHQISGSQPKRGYFQNVLMNRRQDLTMRSTIVPEPALGLDEAGVPRQAALTLMRPFVVQKLVQMGAAPHPLEAQKRLAEAEKGKDDKSVWSALDRVLEERPVMFKRDPALHMHSVQGFRLRPTKGNALQIHPLVTGGFNADFDGDSIDLETPILLRINGKVCYKTGKELESMLNAGPGNFILETKGVETLTYSGWASVKNISFHEVPKKKFRVTLRNGLSLIVSEDHSLMVGRKEIKPEQITVGLELDHIAVPVSEGSGSYEEGVIFGNFLGDGCAELRASGGGRISIACQPEEECGYLRDLWKSTFGVHTTNFAGGFQVSNVEIAKQFLQLCGRYADGKFVGEELLNKGPEFLKGLLAGYILADGSVEITKSGSYLIRTWSRSKPLRDGMSVVASMLGLPHSLRERVAKGETNYLISFGKEAIKKIDFRCKGKKGDLIRKALEDYSARKDSRQSQDAHLYEVVSVEEAEYNDRMIDLTVEGDHVFTLLTGLVVHNTMAVYVPISSEAVDEVRKMAPTNNLFSEATGKVMYQPTLESALGLYKLSVVGKDSKKKFDNHGQLLDAAKTGKINVNDLVTVGGKKTTAGRVLLAAALPEPMQQKILHDHDMVINKKGLDTLLTDLAKNHSKEFGEAVNKLKDIGNGASFGVVQVPVKNGPTGQFAQAKLTSVLNGKPDFKTETKNAIHIPIGAHTLSLKDFETDKDTRDKLIAAAKKQVDAIHSNKSIPAGDKDRRVVAIWQGVDEKMRELHEANAKNSPDNLFTMYQAGVKPGWSQYKQMKLAPMLLSDSQNKIIPTPVTKSFAEGLDISGYWIGMHGARRGSVMKVQEVQQPGYMSKLLQNNMMHLLVNSHDCSTDRGVALPVTEKDVHDRHLAQDFKNGNIHIPAGTLLTPGVVDKIRASKKDALVVVRSPLKCEDEKGICQKCMGLNSTGHHHELGTNVGIISAHTVGERAVQLTLKEFHSGGVAGSGSKALNSFARFQQLTMLPDKIPDAASLAMTSGKIEKIVKDPTGVKIHINGQVHHVPKDASGMPLHEDLPHMSKMKGYVPWEPPKVGMQVKAGQHLSDPNRTFVNPHHLYKATKDIEKVQNQLADEVYDLYRDEGIKRRAVEVMVKAMSNMTKVKDPGDHSGVLRGEFRPLTVVKRTNAELVQQGKKPIEHAPVLKGVQVAPLLTQEDWMAKLQHQKLRETLQDAAATVGVSNIHGTHPVPGIAYGAEFGRTSKDALKPGFEHLKKVPSHHY